MADEKPYPDMMDDKALSNLLSISILFLEVKKPVSVTHAKEWGDNLYEIYKYLVGRRLFLGVEIKTQTPFYPSFPLNPQRFLTPPY